MKQLLASLFFLSILGACSTPPTNLVVNDLGSIPNHHLDDKILTVYADPGGKLYKRLQFINYLEKNDIDVKIVGRCASACTLYLSMETTCVIPDARFGFHGPSASDVYMTSAQRKDDIELMTRAYPDFLDQWFVRRASHLVGDDLLWVEGSELIRHGVPECPSTSLQRGES